MTWHIKHESKKAEPWAVYQSDNDAEEIMERFATKGEAEKWVASEIKKKETIFHSPTAKECEVIDGDPVIEASDESFPASDPPGWIKVTTK